MKNNEYYCILSETPISIPIPTKNLRPDIHSCTNQRSPYVIVGCTIEDLVELNQNNVDALVYGKDDCLH